MSTSSRVRRVGLDAGAIVAGSVVAIVIAIYVGLTIAGGGSKIAVLSMLVYQQYAVVFDAQVGAALCITLLLLTMVALALGVLLTNVVRFFRQQRSARKRSLA